MAKFEHDFMNGQTMGAQVYKGNPKITYYIAFSAIHMPYRKKRWIERSSNDTDNLLRFLPSPEKNYFVDSNQIIDENPEYSAMEFEVMFNFQKDKTNWLKIFDALVFISKGEKVQYQK